MQNVVLVTGTGRRIGFELARSLSQQGYNVLAHYRSETSAVLTLQQNGVATIQADFGDTETILTFVGKLQQRCESFRAIIHNASSYASTSLDLAVSAAQYEAFFRVHMLAPFLINEGLHRAMQGEQDNPADIIHITDINAENPTPAFDSYCATKAGLHNMMLAQAKKYAPNIKVNAVAPGPVLFPDTHTEQIKQQILSETPLAKEGGVEPVVQAVHSILTNPFLTGVSIPVDGGRRLSKR